MPCRRPAVASEGEWGEVKDQGGDENAQIYYYSSSAHVQQLTQGKFLHGSPVWSHDGTRVAFSSDHGDSLGSDYNIWTLDVRSGELKQLTKDPADDYMPSWSPDDKEIAFASARENQSSIWAVNVATGAERKVSTAAGRVDAPSWAPRRARASS